MDVVAPDEFSGWFAELEVADGEAVDRIVTRLEEKGRSPRVPALDRDRRLAGGPSGASRAVAG
jgi:hypothetical protein